MLKHNVRHNIIVISVAVRLPVRRPGRIGCEDRVIELKWADLNGHYLEETLS